MKIALQESMVETAKAAVRLKINGSPRSSRPGATILEAARAEGIEIPTLCYLKGLAPLATCRICMVEEASRGALLPACVTQVSEGMEIWTDTEKVIDARRTVVSLLLASHPETCLVCDKHGSCQLRNVASRLGVGRPQMDRIPLRAGYEAAAGPIIRDLQKCVLCGRCVAACHDLVVQGAMDYHRRGFQTVIATAGEQPLSLPDCIQCAVCIAVCPTGALDFRMKALRREAPLRKTVLCHHCGAGCGIEASILAGRVVRRLPGAWGEGFPMACAAGVLETDFLKIGERVGTPMLRKGEVLQPAEWDEAIDGAAASLKDVLSRRGPGSIAVWCSPLLSCEEGYAARRLAGEALKTDRVQAVGSGIIGGADAPLCTIGDVESSDVILVIGRGVSEQAPAVDFAIRRALRFNGARLILIDEGGESPLAERAHLRITSGSDILPLVVAFLGETLFRIVSKVHLETHALEGAQGPGPAAASFPLTGVSVQEILAAAGEIFAAQRLSIVLALCGGGGRPSLDIEEAGFLLQASWHPGRRRGGILPAGAFMNEIGLARAGLAPGRAAGSEGDGREHDCGGIARSIAGIRDGAIGGLVLLGHDPLHFLGLSLGDGESALQPILGGQLDCFLVIDSRRRRISGSASCILPLCEHEEREGTFYGFEGLRRLSPAAAAPWGQSLPGVQILSKLAQRFGLAIPDAAEDLRAEMRGKGLLE